MRKTFTNYDHSLTNFVCTILNNFEVSYSHEVIERLNRILKQKKYENIVVINVEGMGANFLARSMSDNSFLRCNKIDEVSSTFPSSKYSCNMSLKTGLNPIEHGVMNEEIMLDKFDLEKELVVNKINDSKKAHAYMFSKTKGKRFKDLDDLLSKITSLLDKKGRKYIYAEYGELDKLINEFGLESKEVLKELKNINNKIEKFSKKLNDTVVFVVSNHGYLNCEPVLISRYKEVYNMLDNETFVDSRCCHFFIKEGKKLDFEQVFLKYFVNDFILLSKNEAKSKDVFGTGTDHSLLEDPIGDYVAVAISNKYFTIDDEEEKDVCAGITEDEMFVPIIMIDKK